MFALWVEEKRDVIDHILACVIAGFIRSVWDAFASEQVEEAIAHSIVLAAQIVLFRQGICEPVAIQAEGGAGITNTCADVSCNQSVMPGS